MDLRTCERAGVTADVKALAKGLLELTHERDERTGEGYVAALRFGMLPGPLMDHLEAGLRERFLSDFKADDADATLLKCTEHEPTFEFTVNELVREIVHAVSLEMYAIGDLVV